MMAEATQNKHEKKKRKLYTAEIVWYSILGTLWIYGLLMAILGICGYNIGDISSNILYQAEKAWGEAFGMSGRFSFAIFGTIVMVVAMLGFFIVIYYYASKESEQENTIRRIEERRRILEEADIVTEEASAAESENAAEEHSEPEPVEAESSPAEEPSAPEEEVASEENQPEEAHSDENGSAE